VPWLTYFGDFTIAGAIICMALSVRLLVCYRLLMRYRLFSRAGVGVEMAIQRMADGFILVDEHLKVQTFNPAAAQLLPMLARGAPLPDLPTDAPVLPLEPQEQPVRLIDSDRTLSLDWSTLADRRGFSRGQCCSCAILRSRVARREPCRDRDAPGAEPLQGRCDPYHDTSCARLTAILGYSGALKVYETSEERREFLDTIMRETKRLSRMIEDFLDMSSIQAGSMRYNMLSLAARRRALLPDRFTETRSTLSAADRSRPPIRHASRRRRSA
jgi:hypothetical protein